MKRALAYISGFALYLAYLITGVLLLAPSPHPERLPFVACVGGGMGAFFGLLVSSRDGGQSHFSFLLLVILGLLGLVGLPGWIRFLFFSI